MTGYHVSFAGPVPTDVCSISTSCDDSEPLRRDTRIMKGERPFGNRKREQKWGVINRSFETKYGFSELVSSEKLLQTG